MGDAIPVNSHVSLSPLGRQDQQACVTYLNDRDIYDRTLSIPYPYTAADFQQWLERVDRVTERYGRPMHFAIRSNEGGLIGACGFDHVEIGHKAEVGYWLGRPFWGQGIMTDVVRSLWEWGITELGLVRVSAHVFDFNEASARVLQKNGFQLEGFLRRQVRKDDHFIDARLYARIR